MIISYINPNLSLLDNRRLVIISLKKKSMVKNGKTI